MVYDVIIIGGGAAGLTAGVLCGKYGLNAVIVESGDRVGKKILVTGNGRCNFTNTDMGIEHYHTESPEYVQRIIDRYTPNDIMAFFNELGIASRIKGSMVYPFSNQAQSILDGLRLGLSVHIITKYSAAKCIKKGEIFIVTGESGQAVSGRNIIVAAGGMAYNGKPSCYNILESFGHKLLKPYPALVPLKSQSDFIKGLKGCKYIGAVRAFWGGKLLREEEGEILFTDYGLSGIAITQLSYLLADNKDMVLELDFAKDMSTEDIKNLLKRRLAICSKEDIPADELLTGIVNKKIGIRLLQANGIKPSLPMSGITDNDVSNLAQSLKSTKIKITGDNGFKNAQVSGGGISFEGFDIETMESKRIKGLYAAGEVLDVIGDCGGYNLHFAWASAMYAIEGIRLNTAN